MLSALVSGMLPRTQTFGKVASTCLLHRLHLLVSHTCDAAEKIRLGEGEGALCVHVFGNAILLTSHTRRATRVHPLARAQTPPVVVTPEEAARAISTARSAALHQRAAELKDAAAEADNLKDFLSGDQTPQSVTDYLPRAVKPMTSLTGPVGR
jgi:hypothetical protein